MKILYGKRRMASSDDGSVGSSSRNRIAFWILGLCNNFAYVIMLSAAKDILSVAENSKIPPKKTNFTCQTAVVRRPCQPISTGSVLLANIIPSLTVKIFYPFIMQHIPFGMRHLAIVLLQVSSFLMVAFSKNVLMGLIGVTLASIGSGLGEVTFLSLTTYFPNNVVGAWSSGTGGAGIFGSFAYAALTDKHIMGLKPQSALLYMLVVPIVFTFTYWKLLPLPAKIHRVLVCNLSTYLISSCASSRQRRSETVSDDEAPLIENENDYEIRRINEQKCFMDKITMAKPLISKYMFPLALVYFAEYFINQGLLELLVFDCAHGFGISQSGQYRWYQVLYQLGVFVSRSSVEFIQLPAPYVPLLSVLQVTNAVFLFWSALEQFLPHVIVVLIVVFYEGLLGGAAYVNIYHLLHNSIPEERKEFSLGFVSMSDSFGITCAGFLAIPAHNFICSMP